MLRGRLLISGQLDVTRRWPNRIRTNIGRWHKCGASGIPKLTMKVSRPRFSSETTISVDSGTSLKKSSSLYTCEDSQITSCQSVFFLVAVKWRYWRYLQTEKIESNDMQNNQRAVVPRLADSFRASFITWCTQNSDSEIFTKLPHFCPSNFTPYKKQEHKPASISSWFALQRLNCSGMQTKEFTTTIP